MTTGVTSTGRHTAACAASALNLDGSRNTVGSELQQKSDGVTAEANLTGHGANEVVALCVEKGEVLESSEDGGDVASELVLKEVERLEISQLGKLGGDGAGELALGHGETKESGGVSEHGGDFPSNDSVVDKELTDALELGHEGQIDINIGPTGILHVKVGQAGKAEERFGQELAGVDVGANVEVPEVGEIPEGVFTDGTVGEEGVGQVDLFCRVGGEG